MSQSESLHTQVEVALAQKDYRAVAKLLKRWQTQAPKDPWLQLYIARWQEAMDKREVAEQRYKAILKATTIAKIVTQARQGLARLEQLETDRRETAIAAATAGEDGQALGVLVLEPVTGADRKPRAQGAAKVLKLDPYTAQMQLPSRGWRCQRTGAIGELRFYQRELAQVKVPAFCYSLATLNKINIFQVSHVQQLDNQITVVCYDETDQLGALQFSPAEVTQQVSGALPIFEEVIDLDPWKRLERKQKIQDYANVLDLHLAERQAIVRLCDRTYQFVDGLQFPPVPNEFEHVGKPTLRMNWTRLNYQLGQHIKAPIQDQFSTFGQNALEFIDLFGSKFPAHLALKRKIDTQWDQVFQLYSTLAFRHHIDQP